MPAATPVPRVPSVLTLYDAADLLSGPGCPVCRYADEASDRYLGWFALEGHSDPGLMTALRDSVGMCARHTRFLLAQPGAAIRMTAVYRYVVPAARDQLNGRARKGRPCPACAHNRAAVSRALETLTDGIATGEAANRCRELGGVCIPHLWSAAAAGQPRVTAWLADTMQGVMSPRPARPGWLAGSDRDAEVRAVLRRALPGRGGGLSGACAVCLASALAERDCLITLAAGARGGASGPEFSVCGWHLADLTAAAAQPAELWSVLVRQAGNVISQAQRHPRRTSGLASWPWSGRRRDRVPPCQVCGARADAQAGALAGVAAATGRLPRRAGLLCVRHQVSLRDVDPAAARTLAPGSVAAADQLGRDLAEEFDQTTWAARHRASPQTSAPPPVSLAWRRAAAFLDGGVFGGLSPSAAGPD